MDSWDDTNLSGKHPYVEDFFEDRTVTATGFTIELRSMKDLAIANVLYTYYLSDGTIIILDNNNTIYMGNYMVNLIAHPIQYK